LCKSLVIVEVVAMAGSGSSKNSLTSGCFYWFFAISFGCIAGMLGVFNNIWEEALSTKRDTNGNSINEFQANETDLQGILEEELAAPLQFGYSLRLTLEAKLAAIEDSMRPTFLALSLNAARRMPLRSARHLVHSYFVREHGFLFRGLEPHFMRRAAPGTLHEVDIIRRRAPHIKKALLEARLTQRGVSLREAVCYAAVLEGLVAKEARLLLGPSFNFNNRSVADPLDKKDVMKMTTSLFALFTDENRREASGRLDAAYHDSLFERAAKLPAGSRDFDRWKDTINFIESGVSDVVFSKRNFANPFVSKPYSSNTVNEAMQDLLQRYGKWQNADCQAMRKAMVALDSRGSGRISLKQFHNQTSTWFTESESQLRRVGALDLTGTSRTPQVLIANYIDGPSNCISHNNFFSVCCISECTGLLREIEGKVHAPAAEPGQLLDILFNLASDGTRGPLGQQKTAFVTQKMHVIAERHGGMVPLHGRLFAQLLHHAFPSECPYPHAAASPASLSPSRHDEMSQVASKRERRAARKKEKSAKNKWLWSDLEVLPLQDNGFLEERLSEGAGMSGTVDFVVGRLLALCSIALFAMAAYPSVMRFVRRSLVSVTDKPILRRRALVPRQADAAMEKDEAPIVSRSIKACVSTKPPVAAVKPPAKAQGRQKRKVAKESTKSGARGGLRQTPIMQSVEETQAHVKVDDVVKEKEEESCYSQQMESSSLEWKFVSKRSPPSSVACLEKTPSSAQELSTGPPSSDASDEEQVVLQSDMEEAATEEAATEIQVPAVQIEDPALAKADWPGRDPSFQDLMEEMRLTLGAFRPPPGLEMMGPAFEDVLAPPPGL
jgi:hypothetical protein